MKFIVNFFKVELLISVFKVEGFIPLLLAAGHALRWWLMNAPPILICMSDFALARAAGCQQSGQHHNDQRDYDLDDRSAPHGV